MDDFKTIKANAWSLPPGETRGKLVHIEETQWGKIWYYHDEKTGEYWYQSEIVEKFDQKLKEREKERKECFRKSKNGLKEKTKQESA